MHDKAYTEHLVHGQHVTLHYLDWGGKGRPLILIHALGDSPFLFDGFADSLTSHFRVIAYSRRAHAGSICLDTAYDTRALVEDIKLMADSLRLDKVSLLGWSMGGNEITEFARQYPDRTDRLIYLEGGYDLSEPPFLEMIRQMPVQPFPDESDLKSVETYRNWYHGFWFPDVAWNRALEKNLHAMIQLRPDGSVMTLPDDKITQQMLQSAMSYRRQYEGLTAPALFLFTDTFFHIPEKEPLRTQFLALEQNLINPWREANKERIRREYPHAVITEIDRGSHVSLIFLSRDLIVTSIFNFMQPQTGKPAPDH
jgi:pimeloyl-ACP methyl ester carboxylesterase